MLSCGMAAGVWKVRPCSGLCQWCFTLVHSALSFTFYHLIKVRPLKERICWQLGKVRSGTHAHAPLTGLPRPSGNGVLLSAAGGTVYLDCPMKPCYLCKVRVSSCFGLPCSLGQLPSKVAPVFMYPRGHVGSQCVSNPCGITCVAIA